MSNRSARHFWKQATSLQSSVTPYVIRHVIAFGVFAFLVQSVSNYLLKTYRFDLGISANPFDITGAVLGLLLIFRTNASYDRWWEARKLWGGIVNQSRNLAITGLSFGIKKQNWQAEFVLWVAAFPHICRASLRSEAPDEKVVELIGPKMAAQISKANHMPNYVSTQIGALLQQAVGTDGVNQFAIVEAERQRAQLIDHIGACERILKTPLPLVYVIKIRQYLILFLLALPFSLLHRLQSDWMFPLVTMVVAYVLLSLDQIGEELQNPFAKGSLSHLPLDDISNNIEKNVLALLHHPAVLKGDPAATSEESRKEFSEHALSRVFWNEFK